MRKVVIILLLLLIQGYLPAQINPATDPVDSLLVAGKAMLGSDNAEAIKLAELGLKKSRELKNKSLEAKSLDLLGYCYLFSGEYSKAEAYFDRSLLIYTAMNDSSGMAGEYHGMGQSYFYRAEYRKAMKCYQLALEIYNKLGIPGKQAVLLYETGYVHYSLGDMKMALDKFQTGLNLVEGDTSETSLVNSLINSIGSIYFDWSDYKSAEDYYTRALNLNISDDNRQGEAYSLNNLGNVALKMNKFEKALGYYEKALTIFKQMELKNGEAIVLNNMGMAFENAGEVMKAIRYYEMSVKIRREIKDWEGVASTLGVIADLLIKEGDYQKAVEILTESQRISEESGILPQIKENYRSLSNAYKLMGQPAKALDYYEKFFLLHDSLFNSETQNQFAEMQTRFETGQKEKEIALLRKEQELKSVELKQKNSELQKQRILIISAIGILLIVGIFAFLVYKQYSAKKKAYELLSAQNEEIRSQKEEIQSQRDQIEKQRDEITVINKDTTDSIHYARRIQNALLPNLAYFNSILPGSFILYMPKDIVSGDFYWIRKLDDENIVIACADCTGHGVPGAFMSIVAMKGLEKSLITVGKPEPGKILAELSRDILSSLKYEAGTMNVKDGLDIALIAWNTKSRVLRFSGARSTVYYTAENDLKELKGEKRFIGDGTENNDFKVMEIHIPDQSILYLYSDGYPDQFGGSSRRKFMTRQFKELLLSIADKPATEQQQLLIDEHQRWKGSESQVDDILVMGLRL